MHFILASFSFLFQWKSINEMNKLQHLEKLKIKNNPIMQSFTVETVRQLFIAKISTLHKCNGTEVKIIKSRTVQFYFASDTHIL